MASRSATLEVPIIGDGSTDNQPALQNALGGSLTSVLPRTVKIGAPVDGPGMQAVLKSPLISGTLQKLTTDWPTKKQSGTGAQFPIPGIVLQPPSSASAWTNLMPDWAQRLYGLPPALDYLLVIAGAQATYGMRVSGATENLTIDAGAGASSVSGAVCVFGSDVEHNNPLYRRGGALTFLDWDFNSETINVTGITVATPGGTATATFTGSAPLNGSTVTFFGCTVTGGSGDPAVNGQSFTISYTGGNTFTFTAPTGVSAISLGWCTQPLQNVASFAASSGTGTITTTTAGLPSVNGSTLAVGQVLMAQGWTVAGTGRGPYGVNGVVVTITGITAAGGGAYNITFSCNSASTVTSASNGVFLYLGQLGQGTGNGARQHFSDEQIEAGGGMCIWANSVDWLLDTGRLDQGDKSFGTQGNLLTGPHCTGGQNSGYNAMFGARMNVDGVQFDTVPAGSSFGQPATAYQVIDCNQDNWGAPVSYGGPCKAHQNNPAYFGRPVIHRAAPGPGIGTGPTAANAPTYVEGMEVGCVPGSSYNALIDWTIPGDNVSFDLMDAALMDYQLSNGGSSQALNGLTTLTLATVRADVNLNADGLGHGMGFLFSDQGNQYAFYFTGATGTTLTGVKIMKSMSSAQSATAYTGGDTLSNSDYVAYTCASLAFCFNTDGHVAGAGAGSVLPDNATVVFQSSGLVLQTPGSSIQKLRTTASSTKTTLADSIVVFTGTTGTITLGTAGFTAGRRQTIRNNGTGSLTIAAASGTVDVKQINPANAVEFYFDGTNWNAIVATSGANVTSQNSTYSAQSGDYVLANGSSAGFTITLPAPSPGATVRVKRVDNTPANTVLVQQHASETIDGLNSISLIVQYDSLWVVSDGTNWYIPDALVGNTNFVGLVEAVPAQNMTPTAAWSMNGQKLYDFAQSGWVQDGTTWTRTSNTTFTVPGNVASVYETGVIVKWTESGTQKYGIVASSAYTTLTTVTLVSTSDYVMAASPDANSNNYAQSWLGIPYDFPGSFTWSGVGVSGGTSPTVSYATFSIKPGRRILMSFAVTCTSNAGTFTLTGLPITSAANCNVVAALAAVASSTNIGNGGGQIGNSVTAITLGSWGVLGFTTNAWGSSNLKSAFGQIEYGY